MNACTPPNLSSTDPSIPRKDAVDVASYQSWMTQANFNQLKSEGVKTVVIKLTESTSYTNPYASSHIQMAKNAGLNIAVYHFASFGSTNSTQAAVNAEAIAEADHFVSIAKQYGLPAGTAMILDAEMTTDSNYGNPNWSWGQAAKIFANRLKVDGYPNAKYYTSQALANESNVVGQIQMDPRVLGALNMWVSAYPCTVSANALQNTQFGSWQYNDDMTFQGFSSGVDVSIDYANMFDVISDSQLAQAMTTTVPRIYASELKAVSTGSGYNLSFTLNTGATSGKIILNSTTTADSTVIPLTTLLQGRNSITVDNTQAPEGQYTWKVEASASPVATVAKFSNEFSNQLLDFFCAYGLSIDNNFDSPYFGRVYVTSSGPTNTSFSGRVTGPGVYILDAALSDVTGQGNTPYSGGISRTAYSTIPVFNNPYSLFDPQYSTLNSGYSYTNLYASPARCSVAPDGQLYIADLNSLNSGVVVMDPANPGNNFRQIFGGARNSVGMFQLSGVNIASVVLDLCVTESGDSTKLITVDKTYGNAYANPFGLTKGYNGLRYDIGTSTEPWATAPSGVIFNNAAAGNLLYSLNAASIAPDDRGGFFISQNRYVGQDNQTVPSLIHVSPDGSVDFNSNGLIGGSVTAGMAVSYDGSMLAINYSDEYKVYNVTYNASGAPILTEVYDIAIPATVRDACSMTFDRAGNLYVISAASVLGGYSFPIADNTFTTPAPSSQILDFSVTGINTPQISQLRIFPNPVQDMLRVECGVAIESVRLIDLAGRTIMNIPVNQNQTVMDINLSGVQGGTYILFVNNTAVKVEKR